MMDIEKIDKVIAESQPSMFLRDSKRQQTMPMLYQASIEEEKKGNIVA